MDRGAWRATVHGATKSPTQLSHWAHLLVWMYLDLFDQSWINSHLNYANLLLSAITNSVSVTNLIYIILFMNIPVKKVIRLIFDQRTYKYYVCVSHSVMSDSLWPHGLEPSKLLCPWDPPGKNTGVGFSSRARGSSHPRDRIHRLLHFQHWQAHSLPGLPW